MIVGGGYTGLWAALLATERMPDARIVLVEAQRVGWAASGRNGGFCETSLTHGRENGLSRWPDDMPLLERLGMANLDAIEASEAQYGMDFEFQRTGELSPATEPHQVPWLHEWHDEAVARANATPYGLAAGIFTTNLGTAHKLARRVKAGSVWVNMYHAIDPAVPFGGMKMSGYGREGGLEHLHEFLETKSVWIQTD